MNATRDGRPITAWAAAAARDFAGLTQAEMAEKLTEATSERWTPVMVRNMEKGKRKAGYADIAAVSDITGFPLAWFQADPTSAAVNPRYLPSLAEGESTRVLVGAAA